MSSAALRHLVLAGAAVAVAGAAVQTAPLITALPPLRRAWPSLAGHGTAGHTALTFDDGPDQESTPLFLDRLTELDVRATFFLLGEMAARFPDLPRRIVDGGHEVAVHSWDHRNHLRNPPGRRSTEQLERTADLLEVQTGTRPAYFRPPYGALTAADLAASRRLGLHPVLWTAWGKDWTAHATPASVVASVTGGAVDGGTVLLHDSDCTSAPGSWRSAYGALPALVDWCGDRGLEIGPLGAHGLHP